MVEWLRYKSRKATGEFSSSATGNKNAQRSSQQERSLRALFPRNWIQRRQWKKFDQAQKAAAASLEKAPEKMDAKVFEKVFGKGSATPQNMAGVQKTMQGMVAALRDDGSKGYVANPFSNPKSSVLGTGTVNGKTININVEHRFFNTPATLTQTVGHESGHNLGLDHAPPPQRPVQVRH